jgi:hypothetical protein
MIGTPTIVPDLHARLSVLENLHADAPKFPNALPSSRPHGVGSATHPVTNIMVNTDQHAERTEPTVPYSPVIAAENIL